MRTTLFALLVSASTALSAPAVAGGSLNFSYTARNAEEAKAIRTGLTLYRVAKDIRANGSVTQKGVANRAALAQRGRGNVGVIVQRGNNNDASLRQTGNGNSCGIFQFGGGSRADVSQDGNGAACLVIQASR